MTRGEVSGRWLLIATILLVAIWALAQMTVSLYRDYLLLQTSPASTPSSVQGPLDSGSFELGELLDARLFGVASGAQGVNAANVAEEPEDDTPETRLSLELKGVFNSNRLSSSSALIAERGGEAEIYRIGDTVPGGATLERVAVKYVQLRRNGRLERLSFRPEGSPGSDSDSRAVFSSTPAVIETRPSPQNNSDRVASLRDRLRELREAQRQVDEED